MVVAVVAVAASAYYTFTGEKTNLRSSVMMMDVNNGDTVEMGFGRGGAMFPGTNPKTNTLTMMPIQQKEDGKWYIIERYLTVLKDIEGTKAAVVDQKTGEVRPSNLK